MKTLTKTPGPHLGSGLGCNKQAYYRNYRGSKPKQHRLSNDGSHQQDDAAGSKPKGNLISWSGGKGLLNFCVVVKSLNLNLPFFSNMHKFQTLIKIILAQNFSEQNDKISDF